MKYLVFMLFFVGCLADVMAQGEIERVKVLKAKGNLNCVYKPKFSVSKRSQFYPFNNTDTVKLVSLRYQRNNYPIKLDTVYVDSLIEVRILTVNEREQLTDILYNNFYKARPNYGELSSCFTPRNAILFVDRSGQVKEYILLCFHCNRHEQSSERVFYGSDCTQKMDKLMKLFITVGIKFGTDKSIERYQGEDFGESIILKSRK